MYRDQSATFRMAARLARWLCSSPERAVQVNADHDIMKRLNSIHAVLSRKAKMAALSKRKHGGSSRSQNRHQEPAAQCVVAIASLIHTISNGDM